MSDIMKFRDANLLLEERVTDLMGRLTLEEKAGLLVMQNAPVERLSIGGYHWWNEALHGIARCGVATVFPQAIGLAAAWSPALLQRAADIASTECRIKNNEELASHDGHSRCSYGTTIWSPNINIFRDPRWGRGQETYGEDPMLTGTLGASFVKGLQGDHPQYLKTVATLKHFAVHSGPEPLRHHFDATVSEKDLRDTYLPAFEEGIREGGAQSVMSAYNGVNGSPCVVSHRLLTVILRDEWGFDGAVVGDVDNVNDLYREGGHKWAGTGAAAVAGAIKAGNDLRSGWMAGDAEQAVQQGLLSEDEVDEALRRLLTLRFKLGHFDPREALPWSGISSAVIESDAHKQAAYHAAKQSLVLLKNDGLLPLEAKGLQRVAVLGPTADDLDVLTGNYSGEPYEPVTILQGLKEKLVPAGVEVLSEVDLPFAEGHSSKGSPMPSGVFFIDKAGRKRGLTCRMYNAPEPEGQPVIEQEDTSPGLEWNAALPRPPQLTEAKACVVWSGYIRLEHAGKYTFYTNLHGRSRLEIEGVGQEDAYAQMGIRPRSAELTVEQPGLFPVTITFRQVAEQGFFGLAWDPADGGAAVERAFERAMVAARQADMVILTLGLSHQLEGEEMSSSVEGFHRGDRTTVALPAPQKRLMTQVVALGKPTVLLLSSGCALAFDPDPVNAVLQTWYYGAQGGRAVADALFGAFSPAGRLPVTFYRSDADLPDFEDYAMKGRTYRYFNGNPLYAFGHGLTYTTFEYTDLLLQREAAGIRVRVVVSNRGGCTSDEVVQVYASRPDRQAGEPRRWLVGYQRVHAIEPGTTRTVEIVVPERWLALWDDEQNARVVRPGVITLAAGPSSDNLSLSNTVDWE